MIRLIAFLVVILAIASGLAWLADRPGSLVLTWQGYEIETSVFRAIVILALAIALGALIWSGLRTLWMSPALLGRYMRKQRQRKGLDALSSGMIALSAGDRGSAQRYSEQARKSLPNEPLTHLLRAQTAHLAGDRATAKRIYESMLSSPDTEQLGLRGLYLQATELKEPEAARHFAARALAANPTLAWPVDATFKHQCQDKNWIGALETLATARKYGHIDKAAADRRRAVLLTAQAQILEDSRPDDALNLALDAHGLAKDLVPAAAIAGRLLAAKGNTGKAAKVLQKTWNHAPHPDLATAYAYARIGDSPKDRLERVRKLAQSTPKNAEGPIAIAVAALEAHAYDEARHVLAPLLDDRLTQRSATLMARIEREQHGDKGRVREWLARAITAGRDPVWTADGVVSENWAPVSPVTGELDAFEWRIPVERAPGKGARGITSKAEELIAMLAAEPQATIEALPEPAATDTGAQPAAKTAAVAAAAATAVRESDAQKSGQNHTGSNDQSVADPDVSTPRDQPKEDTATAAAAGVGTYKAKTGQKKKKRFQHPQASVSIQSGSNQDVPAPKKQATETAQPTKPATANTRKGNDAEPFLANHAPDDPGPDIDDGDLAGGGFKPYRAASS